MNSKNDSTMKNSKNLTNAMKNLISTHLQNGGKLTVREIAEISAHPVFNEMFAQFVYDKLFATTDADDVAPAPVPAPAPAPAPAPVIDAETIQIPEWCFMELDDPNNPLFNNPNYSKESLEDLKIIKSRAKSIGIKYVGQLVETDFAKLSRGVSERIEMLKRRIKALYGIEVGTKIPGFAEAIADEVAQFKA